MENEKNWVVVRTPSNTKFVGLVSPEFETRVDEGDLVLLREARELVNLQQLHPDGKISKITSLGTIDFNLGPLEELRVRVSDYYFPWQQSEDSLKNLETLLKSAQGREAISRAQHGGLYVEEKSNVIVTNANEG